MPKDKKSVYEKVNQVTDLSTGEIVSETKEIVKMQEREPDYIKLYLDCVCTFKGLNKALSPILVAFCSYMTWADSKHVKQVIFMNKYTKDAVAKDVGVTIDRVNQALRDITKADIFRKIDGSRGVYEVNPFIIARGQWSDIKVLRANFDFMNGTIEPVIEDSKQMEITDYPEYLPTGTGK